MKRTIQLELVQLLINTHLFRYRKDIEDNITMMLDLTNETLDKHPDFASKIRNFKDLLDNYNDFKNLVLPPVQNDTNEVIQTKKSIRKKVLVKKVLSNISNDKTFLFEGDRFREILLRLYNNEITSQASYQPLDDAMHNLTRDFLQLVGVLIINDSNQLIYQKTTKDIGDIRKIVGILSSLVQFGLKGLQDLKYGEDFSDGKTACKIQLDNYHIMVFKKKNFFLCLFLHTYHGSYFVQKESELALTTLYDVAKKKLMDFRNYDFFHQKTNLSIQNNGIRIKLIFIGDGAVGKTTIRRRLIEGIFVSERKKTIGADVDLYKLELKDPPFNFELHIFDLGGQEIFKGNREELYKGTSAGFLVFDVTNAESFKNLNNWIQEVVEFYGKIPLIVVANKVDLKNRVVSREDALAYANSINAKYIETSAQTGSNIAEVFQKIAQEFYREECRKIISKFRLNTLFPRLLLWDFFELDIDQIEDDLKRGFDASQNLLDLMIFYTPWEILDHLIDSQNHGDLINAKDMYSVLKRCLDGYIAFLSSEKRISTSSSSIIFLHLLKIYSGLIVHDVKYDDYLEITNYFSSLQSKRTKHSEFLINELIECYNFTIFNISTPSIQGFEPISTYSRTLDPLFTIFHSFLPKINPNIPKSFVLQKNFPTIIQIPLIFSFEDHHAFDFDHIEIEIPEIKDLMCNIFYNSLEESLEVYLFPKVAGVWNKIDIIFQFSFQGYSEVQFLRECTFRIIDNVIQLQLVNSVEKAMIDEPVFLDFLLNRTRSIQISKIGLLNLQNADIEDMIIQEISDNTNSNKKPNKNDVFPPISLRIVLKSHTLGSVKFDGIEISYKIQDSVETLKLIEPLTHEYLVKISQPELTLITECAEYDWIRYNQCNLRFRLLNNNSFPITNISLIVVLPTGYFHCDPPEQLYLKIVELAPLSSYLHQIILGSLRVGTTKISVSGSFSYQQGQFKMDTFTIPVQIDIHPDLYQYLNAAHIIQVAIDLGTINLIKISQQQNMSIEEAKKVLDDAVINNKITLIEVPSVPNQYFVGIIIPRYCNCGAKVQFIVNNPLPATKITLQKDCPNCHQKIIFDFYDPKKYFGQ